MDAAAPSPVAVTGTTAPEVSQAGPAVPVEREAPPVRSYRLTALIVAAAMFMEGVDGTVLSTAIPAMAHDLDVDPVHMNIAMTSYLLSLAVFIPASGKLADRWGSRTVFRTAVVLFTAGSVLCGLAHSLSFLVFARLVQGVGGAMMVPVGRLILLRTVPKADLISAMSWLLVPATLGPLVGPPLGGFLVTYLNWRWIFDINVPIGLLGMVLATLYIEQVRDEKAPRMDVLGIVLSGVSLASLTFGLEFAVRGGEELLTAAGLLVAGVATGAAYWIHSRRHSNPVLDFRLMRVKSFAVSVLSGSAFRIAYGSLPFLLPLMLQLGFGLSAAASGGLTFASSVGSLVMRMTAKRILRRWGFRRVLVVNGVLSMAMLGACAFIRPSWPPPAVYGLLLVGGYFQALQFTAYNTIAYADLSGRWMSGATSFYSTFQQLSLSLGITVSAGALAVSAALGGRETPAVSDYSMAFLFMGVIGIASSLPPLRLRPTAGAALSGHHP